MQTMPWHWQWQHHFVVHAMKGKLLKMSVTPSPTIQFTLANWLLSHGRHETGTAAAGSKRNVLASLHTRQTSDATAARNVGPGISAQMSGLLMLVLHSFDELLWTCGRNSFAFIPVVWVSWCCNFLEEEIGLISWRSQITEKWISSRFYTWMIECYTCSMLHCHVCLIMTCLAC